jgi:hypothetical protein
MEPFHTSFFRAPPRKSGPKHGAPGGGAGWLDACSADRASRFDHGSFKVRHGVDA